LSREEIESLGSPLAASVEVREEVGSTQQRARELARAGAPHGTLVV
jgi:BirA family biotin operon repressor/biotin-[acetyl-CoA-carboxylase] ligase